MNGRTIFKNAGRGLAAGAAIAVAGYAALVILNRVKYGDVEVLPEAAKDSLLDWYIPDPEVREHHSINIDAPPEVVMAAAKEMELLKSPVIHAIIRARELVMGGTPDARPHPTRLMEQMVSIGWVVLAETAGREIVFGAVTQPWDAAPVFRSIPSAQFHDFAEPGWVKIAWTLRTDPAGDDRTLFTTETRVATTDAAARERFRTYWSFVAPGVELIRLALLRPLKHAAERRAKAA